MQISTNRVNFTNSSVAHFNYVKFLGQQRSTEKGVQDIVTILGLHTDEITLSTGLVSASRRLRSASRKLKKRTLALVPISKFYYKIERTVQWYQSVLFVMNSNRQRIKVECDIRIGIVTMECKLKTKYVITIKKYNLQKAMARGSKLLPKLYISKIKKALTLIKNVLYNYHCLKSFMRRYFY